MNRDSLSVLVRSHEGTRLKPYFDCCGKPFRECRCESQGKLSIGAGRNIEDNGITDSESKYLLENDLSRVVGECRDNFPFFNALDDDRQNSIADMLFNMGLPRFKGFVKMLAAVAAGDFKEAANQIKSSIWAGQVGARAVDDAALMENGSTVH